MHISFAKIKIIIIFANNYLQIKHILMKTNAQLLLLLIGLSFSSCNSTVKNQATPISDLDKDFPTTEKLELKPFNKYNILNEGFCMIDDSTLWCIREGKSDFGTCYNLYTGDKLSIIASKGRAANELTQLENLIMIGDSVQLYTAQNTIKTFAKQDIMNNIPMGERKFSVTTVPDSIWVRRIVKLPNGSVLATIMPALSEFEQTKMNEFNKKSVAIFNDKKANSYETINYESFDMEEAKDMELPVNDLIKCAYADGSIEIKNNDIAVFSVSHQFILYTFDIKNGNVINEKRYTQMQRTGGEGSLSTTNDRQIEILSMKINDKYILCFAKGFFSEKDKDSKLDKRALFVFDWELNPIKKFYLPYRENGYYTISNDGRAVYFRENNEDGLVLYKADLNI